MNIMTLEHIGITLGDRTIFSDVTAGIEDHDRIGVIGVNGTGKSTILSILAGKREPDSGTVITRNGLKISYLSQNPVFDPEKSVLENVSASIYGQEEHWNTEGEAKALLQRFGISDPDVSPAILSGGQKKRAALVSALLTPSDLLILDEPTNHLDHDMIEWLENWLLGYRGALLMVTHDRYFLDEVTTTIWEIDKSDIFRYEGNYEKYLETKQERMDFARAAERKMAALYKQDLAWMMRGARARSTKQKAHIQRFEALRDRDKIVEERNVAISSLPSRLGNKIIEIESLSKSYDGKLLFRDFTYTFTKNDRIGIIGPNGCGKSTLIKIILGIIPPDTGTVSLGQTVIPGFFSQENEALDESLRVIDYIKEGAEFIRTTEGLVSASSMCERFLFDSNDQYTPISKLSGGEKRRLYLLRILMEAPNVLVLDEPTNDLDIQTLQILEDYLDHFAGVVIVVSHDRYFLDRVVNRIFSFEEDKTLLQNEGGYEEYRIRRLVESSSAKGSGSPLQKSADPSPSGRKQTASEGASSMTPEEQARPGKKPRQNRPKTKLSYTEQREYDSLEGEIDDLTSQSEALEKEMEKAATSYTRLEELSKQKQEIDALLDQKIERFLELQDMVESFQNS